MKTMPIVSLARRNESSIHFNAACKASSGALCEHCLSTFVIAENPVQRFCDDTCYVLHIFAVDAFTLICELPEKIWKSIVSFPRQLSMQNNRKHEHLPNQQICERCIGTFGSSGFVSLDELREWALVGFRAVGFACELIAIFFVGIIMICATFCPDMMRKKSDEQLEAEAAAAARKDSEFANQRRQFHTWSDEQDAAFLRRQKEDHAWQDDQNAHFVKRKKERHDAEDEAREQRGRYDKTIDKIEHAVQGNEVLDVGSALLDDDLKVAKLKNTAKAVEDHKADPRELQKLADELLESRRELNRKDARRRQLFADFRDKEWNANRLYKDADAKAREGKHREADDLARKADGMMRDANGLYNEFKSV